MFLCISSGFTLHGGNIAFFVYVTLTVMLVGIGDHKTYIDMYMKKKMTWQVSGTQ
jgi:hypothetical protein